MSDNKYFLLLKNLRAIVNNPKHLSNRSSAPSPPLPGGARSPRAPFCSRRAASGCSPSPHRPFYGLCQLQAVDQPEPQAVAALHDDLVYELAEQLPVKGVQEVRPGLQGFDQLLGLPDGLILLGLQGPFLLQLQGAELFRQLVPA